MSDKLTMEESTIIQRYKQRLAEKRAEADKNEQKEEEKLHEEQLDFEKFLK